MRLKYLVLIIIISLCSIKCTVVDTELLELVLEIKNQNQELLDEVKSLQTKSDSLINEIKNSAAKQEELLNKVTELQAELAKVLTQIGALSEKLDSQDADLEAIKSELADLQEKYQAILEQLEQLQRLSQILAEIETLKGQLSELDGKYQVILGSLAQNQEELTALNSQIEALQNQLTENLNKISELTKMLGEQGADIGLILIQIEELKAGCAEIKSLLEDKLFGKSPVPSNGLVGWWPFNGNTNDESGNGNNAQNNGALLTIDRFGDSNKAYFFDNNFMIVPHNNVFDFNDFSISLWIQTSQMERAVILTQNVFDNAQKERFSVAINDVFQNSIQFAVKYNQPNCLPGIGWEKNEIVNPIFDQKFHHFVGIASGSITRIFIDGELIGTLNSNFEKNSPCYGGDIQIGRGWKNFINYFKGSIDDIAIWNRALATEEVSKIYKGEGF